jgi:hypothetical protein
MGRPVEELTKKDFTSVEEACRRYISMLENGEYGSDKMVRFVFEHALEAVYGMEVWEYVAEKEGE